MKIIDFTAPSPQENIKFDEELLLAYEQDPSKGEILRFWESPTHFVVLGRSNVAEQEVYVDRCVTDGIPILRRCSGGGTVLQGPGCLNYALILRIDEKGPTADISKTNEYVMGRMREALSTMSSSPPRLATDRSSPQRDEGRFQIQGCTDLTLNGKKFSGNAQRRLRKYLLFHGTFLYDFDLNVIDQLLKQPYRQPKYREARGHLDFTVNISINVAEIKKRLLLTFVRV